MQYQLLRMLMLVFTVAMVHNADVNSQCKNIGANGFNSVHQVVLVM